MRLFQTYKKFFNFSSLTIFIFFISCGVKAQESSQSIAEIPKTVEKNTNISQNNTKKQKINKKKNSKRITKTKKITRKIVRKKIIKKIYVVKEQPAQEENKINEQISDSNELKEAIAIAKQHKSIKSFNIDNDYFLEIELKENCQKVIGNDCFKADKFFQEPYFHYTLLTIFQQKIIGEQYYEGGKIDKEFIRINDGEYFFTTKNNNRILAIVRKGIINELMLIEGNIENENKITSKCQYADKLLAFHRLYSTKEAIENNIFYSDKKNFRGLIEATIFNEKYHPQIFYATMTIPNKASKNIQEINLCKRENKIEAIERDYTKSECSKKFLCTMQTLEKYGSEGIATRDNNFSFDDFYKKNEQINLDKNQLNGLIDEVNKLSSSDKDDLKNRCFNDKNIDLINCSISEQCEDYLSVSGCEVEYYFDNDKK